MTDEFTDNYAMREAEEWAHEAPTSDLIARIAAYYASHERSTKGDRYENKAAMAELDLRIPRRRS